jgi:hypothetical protein
MTTDNPADSLKMRRIQFPIEHDADGYPPISGETLWASEIGSGVYRVENIPFFATQVSFGDVVKTKLVDGMPTFVRGEERGGHSTFRLVVFNDGDVAQLRSALRGLGVSTEGSHLPRLFSVDVPPEADLSTIRAFLRRGIASGKWDVEEADVPADLDQSD